MPLVPTFLKLIVNVEEVCPVSALSKIILSPKLSISFTTLVLAMFELNPLEDLFNEST